MKLICKTLNCRHDVAQIAGLTAVSFGQEDVDRYIVVYKKDHAPSEDEVFARRNGEEWNAETAKKYAQMVNWQLKVLPSISYPIRIGIVSITVIEFF